MKALIFNSGLGKRMAELTMYNHKSMVKLANGETIFERQLRILSSCGIKDFVVTVGPFKEQLKAASKRREFSGCTFTFVNNPDYDTTNYIYSMYLARELLDDDVLMLHGDLVFDRKLAEAIISSEIPSLGCVNMKKALPEKDFKARVVDGNIHEVSISIFDENCCAFQPFYKLAKADIAEWVRKVEEYIAAGTNTCYAENAMNESFPKLSVKAFSYEDFYIDEVDNPDDLKRVSADIRLFDFKEQPVFEGEDSHKMIGELLKKHNAKHPLLVCDKIFDKLFIKEYFDSLGMDYVTFDDFEPNPVYEDVAKGVELFRKEKCDFIISVGGGSSIDTAKNIKLFSVLSPKENYLEQPSIYSPVVHLAVPTTAGTGSESTRFSVLYHKGAKQSVAHDCILPDYVVLEPKLLVTLPDYQKKATMLDALCQSIEAFWSVNSTDSSKEYSRAAIPLIFGSFEKYLAGDITAAASMLQASNLAGRAINITQTTAAHAMSYKLTSLYKTSHGHACALCLPLVWRYMLKNTRRASDPRGARYLAGIFEELDSLMGGVERFESFYASLSLPTPELTDRSELDLLADSVNPVRLGNNPVPLSRDAMKEMYKRMLAKKK